MRDPMEILEENLDVRLDEKGLSRSAFAEKIGMSPSQLSNILRGRGSPTLEVLTRLAKGLGISVGALLTDPADMDLELALDRVRAHFASIAKNPALTKALLRLLS